jgi:fructoselysine 6-kinase
MPNLTVAVVGDNTIDRYVGPRGRDYIGGNAVNVAVQLAERGFDVRYFGAVGSDPEGSLIGDELVARGVNVDGLVTLPGPTAMTLLSIDASGDRHIEEERYGVAAEYYPRGAELASMAAADWVQLGMVPRASELRQALRDRRRKVRVGQDCSVSTGYRDLSVAFESADLDRAHTVGSAALSGGAELSVVTLGAHGSIAFSSGAPEVNQPALGVEAIDTTGAGDSFIAGFVATFLQSLDVARAMATGAAWAARTCTHFGGFPQREGRHTPL